MTNMNSIFGSAINVPAYQRPDTNQTVRFVNAIGSTSQLYQVVFQILNGTAPLADNHIRNLATTTYGLLLKDALDGYEAFNPNPMMFGHMPEFITDYIQICHEMIAFYQSNHTLVTALNQAKNAGVQLVPEYPPMDFTSTPSFNLSIQKK